MPRKKQIKSPTHKTTATIPLFFYSLISDELARDESLAVAINDGLVFWYALRTGKGDEKTQLEPVLEEWKQKIDDLEAEDVKRREKASRKIESGIAPGRISAGGRKPKAASGAK